MPAQISHLSPLSAPSLNSYILSFAPLSSTHLVLTHPSPQLSLVDAATLQLVETLKDAHMGDVMDVVASGAGGEGIWSAAKDGRVVRWDMRSRRAAHTIRANVRQSLPLLSLALSERNNLLVAGSELVGSDAYLLFWDIRQPSQTLYTHSQTHSDDITSLSFLPSSSSSYLLPALSSDSSASTDTPIPSTLLLSTSTDGLLSLSDPLESDEDDAVWGCEGLGGSVAKGGWYWTAGEGRGELKIWGRSDMDSVGFWGLGRGAGEEGVEFRNPQIHPSSSLKPLSVSTATGHPHPTASTSSIYQDEDISTTKTAEEEHQSKSNRTVQTEYLVDVCPGLGVSGSGVGMVGVGNNNGDIVLMHHKSIKGKEVGDYRASAFLLSPKASTGGHKDVVRCMYWAAESEALYTGSEDGILCAWHLPASLNLLTGNSALDRDEGDGREDVDSDDSMDEKSESGSEAEDGSDDAGGMDVDSDDEEMMWKGRKRSRGEIIGEGKRRKA